MQDNIPEGLIAAFERQYDVSFDHPDFRNERLAMRYGWQAAMEHKPCLVQIQEPASIQAARAAVAALDERAAFEAWAKSEDMSIGTDCEGYIHSNTAAASCAWQARASLAATPAAAAQVVLPEPQHWVLETQALDREFDYTGVQKKAEHWKVIGLNPTALFTEQQLRAALLAGVSAPAAQAPVLYVSKGQLDNFRDPDGPDSTAHGRYLPARVTPAGKFTTPLFAAPQDQAADFQQRVQPWMIACFGPEISADRIERNHRFLEESLELVQSLGCTASEAHQLVDYVFGRPAGEPVQEAGGVMVTLAALSLASGLDMHACGETELARIWTKVEAIRAKQATKPKHSPLPMHAPQAQADARDAIRELIAKHSAELEHNAYAYFELAYTRRTGWMAWITDKPLASSPVINPGRKVLCAGQGDTPEEACSAALAAAKGE